MTEKTPRSPRNDAVPAKAAEPARTAAPVKTAAAAKAAAPATKSAAPAKTAPVAQKTAKPATPPSDSKREPSAAATSAAARDKPAPAKTAATTPPVQGKQGRSWPLWLLFVLVLLLAAGLWFVHQSQQHTQRSLQSLQNELLESSDQLRRAGEQASQLKSVLDGQAARIAALDDSFKASRAEYRSLDEAFQLLTDRGSDLVLLNDIDHLVVIAQQQLQLGGNVSNAIISLETAQAQLARANRPALASLQQTINGDLDRLRAARTIDVGLLSARLDELAALVQQAPLLVPDDVSPTGAVTGPEQAPPVPQADPAQPVSGDDSGSWWESALARGRDWTDATMTSLREDFDRFISVRRVDDAAALLISPDQAARFRDNLRLRIMTAQLALMMGQSEIWKSETHALVQAIGARFDAQSTLSRQALRIARELEDTDIELKLPDVGNSITALEAVRELQAQAPDAGGEAQQ
ncbi:MAG: uroporphyrinogen-III C-methyltransferase [Castellaniella sp.]